MTITYKTLFISILFLLPFFTLAQTDSSVSLILNPENPSPGTTVKAEVKSFSTDLNKARISWILNSKIIATGTGQLDFSFTTGPAGIKTTLEVKIITENGNIINKKITFDGGEVDLLLSAANSFTPPFYRGRSIPSLESEIKVVAIPNIKVAGRNLKQEDFVYKWLMDFNPISSGFNQSSFIFKQNLLNRLENIEVQISGVKNEARASKNISFFPEPPKIVFYEKIPGRGINYNQALVENWRPNKKDLTVVASPYYFSGQNPNQSNLIYKWFMNDELISEITSNELPLQISQTGGQTKISVEVSARGTLNQEARNSVLVKY